MTALAIDSFRQCARVDWLTAGFSMTRRNSRIGVVAAHAFVGYRGRWQRVVTVISGIHGPHAAVFRIPGERKFDKGPTFSSVEISPDMVAGAHDVIDLGFLHVNFLTARSNAPTPLVVISIALQHGIPGAGFFVKKRTIADALRPVKGPCHSREGISPRDLRVAAGAELRVNV